MSETNLQERDHQSQELVLIQPEEDQDNQNEVVIIKQDLDCVDDELQLTPQPKERNAQPYNIFNQATVNQVGPLSTQTSEIKFGSTTGMSYNKNS